MSAPAPVTGSGPVVLGVDAGNSKTVALVAGLDGTVLGRGRAGIGDIYADTAEGAVAEVHRAVSLALQDAGRPLSAVRHAAFRLAGIDWPEDEAYWDEVLTRDFAGLSSWSVKNDGYALLRLGDPDGVGVSVTAGSGPAVAARGRDGREFTAGWWIHHDLGGRGLGNATFRAVLSADLGIGPATVLTGRLLTLLELPDVETLVHAFTRREGARPYSQLWRVARTVLQAAEEGDAVALGLVHRQAEALASYALVAARRAGFADAEPVPVVIGGSILTSEHGIVRELVTERIHRLLPAVVHIAAGSPVDGALLDALAEAGSLDPAHRDRVLAAAHPAEFLQT